MQQPEAHALHELGILRQVEDSSRLNNRLAAQKLGVSIKLAHALLKRMVGKGLLHVTVVHSRRWDYFLTPQGLTEKTRLTLEFLDFSLHFYREARRRSAQLCRDLAESGVRRIAFLGTGELAEITWLGMQEWGLELTAVYAEEEPAATAGRNWKLETGNSAGTNPAAGRNPEDFPPPRATDHKPQTTGRLFLGRPVKPLCELRHDHSDAVIVCLYDKAQPMHGSFLPGDAPVQPGKLRWIFAGPPPATPSRETP